MAEQQDHFKLSSSEGGFASRSDDVFGNLDAIEKKHEAKERAREKFSSDRHKYINDDPILDDIDKPSTSRPDFSSRSGWSKAARDYEERGGHKDRDNCGSQSDRKLDCQFKAPRGRAPRGRYVPDYKKNPQKYTCYDLSDVSSDQMSNRSNAAAAFEFLRERRELKEAPESDKNDPEEAGESFKPVFFKKPKIMQQNQSKESSDDEAKTEPVSGDQANKEKSTASYQSGKFKMAEYVVGQGSKKTKKTKTGVPIAVSDKVGLQHLYEEDEVSDEEDSPNESKTANNRSFRKRPHPSDDEDS